MKNLINATMESNILLELAAFDMRVPIEFSVSFEDSNADKEVTDKTENVTDDNNTNSVDTNDLPEILLSSKKEINEELPQTTEEQSNNNELNADQHSEQNVSKHITTPQTEIIQNTKTNSDYERKRKQELEIDQNKRAKNQSTQENVSNHLSGHDKVTETFVPNLHFAHQDIETSQLNPINANFTVALFPNICESDGKTTKSYLLSELSVVSENMRHVLEAHAYHKQYNTPYDSYEKQKFSYFNKCYDIIFKIIIPQERNTRFMINFLRFTVQHAVLSRSLYKCSFNNFKILLKELIDWAKDKQKSIKISSKQENTVQPRLNQTTSQQENIVQPTLTGSNCYQGLVLESTRHRTEDKGSNDRTKADTICIFSEGPPGNKISINIDPNLSKCMATSNNVLCPNNESLVVQATKKSSVDLPRTQMPFQTQLGTSANHENKHLREILQRPPQIQQLAPWTTNNPSHLYPQMNMLTVKSPIQRNPTYNDIFTKQIKQRLSQGQKPTDTQNGHTMPGQSQHLQPQSMPSPWMLPQTQPTVNTAHRQQTQVPPPYGQSPWPPPPPYDSHCQARQKQVQSQFANSQHMPSQPFGQPQQHMLVMYKKGQLNMQTQFGRFSQVPNDTAKFQNMQPQCEQIHRQTGYLQSMQPQYSHVPTLQSQQPILPQHVPQHVSPQIGHSSAILSDCQQRLQIGEWRQGFIEPSHHHQGHIQQPHKNAPRSTSTDSGFVSPLNFNTSSDQTLPSVPDDTQPSQILITHVTSLNPKVPFMAVGNCVNCNKATKQVCMGCMKVYYCTYECQVQDWTTHGPDCSKLPTTTTVL